MIEPSRRHIHPARAAALAGLLAAAALLGAGASAGHADAPPEVQALLTKMAALAPTSARFSGGITVRPRHLPPGYAGLGALVIDIEGEETFAPQPTGIASVTVLQSREAVREVGGKIYVDDPKLGSRDGDRPWIAETAPATQPFYPTTPLIGGGPLATPFSGLAKLVATASDVKVLGPATVDGQAVTRVSFTIDPFKLAGSRIKGALLRKLRSARPRATSRLEVDLSSSGLPVRVEGVIAVGKIRVGLTADVLAIDEPVSVQPPPAAQTITAAEAEAILKKAAEQQH